MYRYRCTGTDVPLLDEEAAEVEGIVKDMASVEVGYDEVKVVVKGPLFPDPNAATRFIF